MRRRAKPKKIQAAAKRTGTGKSPKGAASRVRDLETRLAEALDREAEARKREADALEQQTAASEILRVISTSPTDLQPVFETIAEHAVKLCDAAVSGVLRFDGALIHLVAYRNFSPAMHAIVPQDYPMVPTRRRMSGRAILDGMVVHVPDVLSDPDYPQDVAHSTGWRSFLSVPMLLAGQAIGAVTVVRIQPGPFSDRQIELLKTFADQAVIAIENVRLFNETKEALEQQTASGEVLQVISGSPTDIQPVLDTIARNAARLCEARDSAILLRDGEALSVRSHHGPLATADTVPIVRGSPSGRAILEARAIHVHDLQAEEVEFPVGRAFALRDRFRTALAVPLVREGDAIGVILVRRAEVRPFVARQVELLQTFADEAVIAIENARLFKELEDRNHDLREALDQQTATSDILRVISCSLTDVQPVFETIAESAVRLCGAHFCAVYHFDGELVHLAAHSNFSAEALGMLRRRFPMPPGTASPVAQVIRDGQAIHIADVELDADTPAAHREVARMLRYRSFMAIPMLSASRTVGCIALGRVESGHFANTSVRLVQTFADQAAIAIENVRLFTELHEKNRALTEAHAQVTEALEQQTATSEVLRVISSSPTDVQPVFDTIAQNAVRICDAQQCTVFRYDGALIHLAAHHDLRPEALDAFRQVYPLPVNRDAMTGRAIGERAVVHIPDILSDPDTPEVTRRTARRGGWRTAVMVPLLRGGTPIGAIAVGRSAANGEPRPFATKELALLQTFADQAVIAIENVRLFTELQTRNSELRTALEQQTATSELLKVIGRSTFDLQPVFDTLAENAVTLCGAERAFIFRLDGRLLRGVASYNASPELKAFVEQNPIAPGRGSGTARAAVERRTIHIHDILTEPEHTYQVSLVDPVRTLLAVPILRADEVFGVIVIYRHEVVPFTDSQITLMETFADQAAIAIENVRLFQELEARNRELAEALAQQTATGEVLRVISRSAFDLEAVLETLIENASRLVRAEAGAIFKFDGELMRLAGAYNASPELREFVEQNPHGPGRGTAVGRAVLDGRTVHIPDVQSDPDYTFQGVHRGGFRTVLGVPMLREGSPIGVFSVWRSHVLPFTDKQIELVTAFADQGAIAIENVRLFREIEQKSRQLEAASRHKSEFLANMSHELRTPLNAIIGFSEVLTERMFGELNEKQDEYLRDIHASGQHLLSLINDILDLSKIEAGRMELELKDFDLPQAIGNAVTLVRERAGRRGIALHQAVDPRLGQICGDERKIKQVILNLLSNALKFTPEGGRVDVRATVADGMAAVSVTDTGVGIAPEDHEAVFEEFRQVGTADKKVEGTGLGLALSRRFIELHGGRIWVESQVGRGSTFAFTLPLCVGE